MASMDWVDDREEEIKEEKAKGYFNIEEGSQSFILLTHLAPLAQVFDGKKYRPAEEGERGASIKGVGWVLQDGNIKQAKLPYTIVKSIRALQQDPEWEFEIPFRHTLTLNAKNAGTKEVEYTLTPSPKIANIPEEILDELKKKQTPEEIVEKIKGKTNTGSQSKSDPVMDDHAPVEYPTENLDPRDIPF